MWRVEQFTGLLMPSNDGAPGSAIRVLQLAAGHSNGLDTFSVCWYKLVQHETHPIPQV